MCEEDEQRKHNDKSDDTLMDVGELIELLQGLPKFARVTMAAGDKVVPVNRLVSFGLYDEDKNEFNTELGNQKTQQLFAICFVPKE